MTVMVVNYLKRKKMKARKDKKIFSKTAMKVKDINLPNIVYRGGTRL